MMCTVELVRTQSRSQPEHMAQSDSLGVISTAPETSPQPSHPGLANASLHFSYPVLYHAPEEDFLHNGCKQFGASSLSFQLSTPNQHWYTACTCTCLCLGVAHTSREMSPTSMSSKLHLLKSFTSVANEGDACKH